MRKEEPSNNVKLAATNALLNSLEFTKANFDKEVCENTRTLRTYTLSFTWKELLLFFTRLFPLWHETSAAHRGQLMPQKSLIKFIVVLKEHSSLNLPALCSSSLCVCVCVFQTERHFIMQVVCEATQCPDTRVSSSSLPWLNQTKI